MGDEVDRGLGAGLGSRVEVGAEELLEVGFGERFDVLDVAVDCNDWLAVSSYCGNDVGLPRSKSKASEAT